MKVGYLYSRYPVLAQTSCDTEEILELQRLGHEVLIGSVHSPLTPFREEGTELLSHAVSYAPPAKVLAGWQRRAQANRVWPNELVKRHKKQFKGSTDPLARAREALFFADLFKRNGIEHFRVHVANCAAHTALFVKEMTGIPFSLMAHGQWFMKDLGHDGLLGEICSAAEFIAMESDYSRGMLSARCPDSASKIHRVYNGIDLTRFELTNQAGGPNGAPLRLLSVAQLLPLKGFGYLLEACADLKRRGLSFTCEIAGDGPLREAVLSKIDELKLDGSVRLVAGMRGPQLREKIRGCDALVVPAVVDDEALSDIFPATILDAMAFAKPVVATMVGGIPEAVIHNATGVMVPPCDSLGLADALALLAREPLLRIALGKQARARIEQQFQIPVTVPALVELLNRARQENAPVASPNEPAPSSIAYLVDQWPGDRLPLLEAELHALARLGQNPQVFVCRANPRARPSRLGRELSPTFHFLPDEMGLESEWQVQSEVTARLLAAFATDHAAGADATLRSARYALSLLPRMREAKIRHVHATDTHALLTAVMLKYLLDVNVSAVIERDTDLPIDTVRAAATRCLGGRCGSRRLVRDLEGDFLFDSNAWSRSLTNLRGALISIGASNPLGAGKLWKQWSDCLTRWR